jgi:hypothetical protein
MKMTGQHQIHPGAIDCTSELGEAADQVSGGAMGRGGRGMMHYEYAHVITLV